jgi:hypothetical protein
VKCTEHDKVMPHYRCAESEQWLDERMPQGSDGCERCALLRKEALFRYEQQLFAASVAANLADLNDYDGRLAALLSKETERRKRAEDEATLLAYKLQVATGTEA